MKKTRRVIKIKCEKCNIDIGSTAFTRHIKSCLGPKRPKKIRGIDYDPNSGYKNGTREAWNKGLTKETNKIVKQMGETISKNTKGRTGRKHTEETKKKLSDVRIKYLEENPEKVPYLLNHSSKISYPEQYFLDCFSKFCNVDFQYPINRYKVDFVNIKEKLYLEIDGEQHYCDKRIVEHDKKRTKRLLELGWEGIRIRWSEFKKLSEEEKIKKVNYICKKMKWR